MFKTGSLVKVDNNPIALYHKIKVLPKVLEKDKMFLILDDKPYSGQEINNEIFIRVNGKGISFNPETDFYLVLYENDLYHFCADLYEHISLVKLDEQQLCL